jgi:3-oxoacyl-[acyl-carrier protein] reductase
MLDKKVAIVTGASRGIGHAIAMQLAGDDYAVCMVSTTDEDKLIDKIGKVREKGQPVIYVQGDISTDESRKAIIESVMKNFGRIDVLVNNAGVAPKVRMDILETIEESMDHVLKINLYGTFFLTQLVANQMISIIESGKFENSKSQSNTFTNYRPKIINISSMSAYTSSTNRGEYCISKAGISMVTTLFADRLAEYGINVYEIRPGIIRTDMTATVKDKYDNLIANGLTPIKRWGFPEDIANAVSVLCSGKLDYSTGEVINVDGGFHIQRL